MRTTKKSFQFFLILALTLLSTACSIITGNLEETTEPDENMVGMANPAAVYCEGLGYDMENVQRNGGGDADCIFPDGSRFGQWDFLSGRCGQEFTYCKLNGGTIEEGANILTCHFADGSTCDEYQYFLGNCSPGDHPDEGTEIILAVEEDDAYPVEEAATVDEQAIEIKSFEEARDYLAAYFLNQYGIEHTEPWIEENITPEDAGPKSTFCYVSGPLTIVLSAEASAPYAPLYEINEASYIVNGFYWEGTLSFDGLIEEITVYPPGTVLNEAQARDAVLIYLDETYGLEQSGEWTEESFTPTEDTTMIRVYSSDNWVVEVEFGPAAPLVQSYIVRVEIRADEILWEGEITLRGEIEEISFTQ